MNEAKSAILQQAGVKKGRPSDRPETIANEYTGADIPEQNEAGHQNEGFQNDNNYAANELSNYVPPSNAPDYLPPGTSYDVSQPGDDKKVEISDDEDNDFVSPTSSNFNRPRLATSENLYVTSNDMHDQNVNNNYFNPGVVENIDEELKNVVFEKDEDDLDKSRKGSMANEYIAPS